MESVAPKIIFIIRLCSNLPLGETIQKVSFIFLEYSSWTLDSDQTRHEVLTAPVDLCHHDHGEWSPFLWTSDQRVSNWTGLQVGCLHPRNWLLLLKKKWVMLPFQRLIWKFKKLNDPDNFLCRFLRTIVRSTDWKLQIFYLCQMSQWQWLWI